MMIVKSHYDGAWHVFTRFGHIATPFELVSLIVLGVVAIGAAVLLTVIVLEVLFGLDKEPDDYGWRERHDIHSSI